MGPVVYIGTARGLPCQEHQSKYKSEDIAMMNHHFMIKLYMMKLSLEDIAMMGTALQVAAAKVSYTPTYKL